MRLGMLFVLLVCVAGLVRAEDWPQWLGPRRDGVYREAGVIGAIPAGGLKVRWRAEIGGGYSGVAVWNGKVIVVDYTKDPAAKRPDSPFDRGSVTGTERILCLRDKDGSVLWKIEYECRYTISYSCGPRATPTVDPATGKVYTMGSEGNLYCIDIETGKTVWNLKMDGPTPTWGFAGHPLIDGDRVLVLSSGAKALVTAFNKHTGEIVWESEKVEPPGYAAPKLFNVGGKPQVWAWSSKGLYALDRETGKTLWHIEYGPVKYGAACNAPVQIGDLVYMTSEFEGSAVAKVDPSGLSAKKLWQKGRQGRELVTMHNLMSPIIIHEGMAFGINTGGHLLCVDPADGHTVWKSSKAMNGDPPLQGWCAAFITPYQPEGASTPKHFFLASDNGDLVLCRLSAKEYEEIGRTHLLDPTNKDNRRPVIWCHPAYANRAIYWRNDKEVVSWSIAE